MSEGSGDAKKKIEERNRNKENCKKCHTENKVKSGLLDTHINLP